MPAMGEQHRLDIQCLEFLYMVIIQMDPEEETQEILETDTTGSMQSHTQQSPGVNSQGDMLVARAEMRKSDWMELPPEGKASPNEWIKIK